MGISTRFTKNLKLSYEVSYWPSHDCWKDTGDIHDGEPLQIAYLSLYCPSNEEPNLAIFMTVHLTETETSVDCYPFISQLEALQNVSNAHECR